MVRGWFFTGFACFALAGFAKETEGLREITDADLSSCKIISNAQITPD
jgi:hypothetical protein